MVKAGRVAIVPKGEFTEGLQYTRLDLVTYQASAYIAKKDSVSIFPTDPDYWMRVMDLSNIDVATVEKAGTVKPDGITVKITEDGTIYVDDSKIEGIKKCVSDLKEVAFTGNYEDLENPVRVKGNTELNYRTGDINLTPADIGAVNKTGDEMTGPLVASGFGMDNDIHNQMQVNAYLGEALDASERIFLQEDFENDVVNIGIVGKGAIGVNKAKDADTLEGKHVSELIGSTLSGTLSAGGTTISFTDPIITQESMIDIYTDVYGVNPVTVVYNDATHTLTLTFEAQKSDVRVRVRVM